MVPVGLFLIRSLNPVGFYIWVDFGANSRIHPALFWKGTNTEEGESSVLQVDGSPMQETGHNTHITLFLVRSGA